MAVFIQMSESARPPEALVCVCVYHIRASPLNMGLILQNPRQP